MATSGDRGDRDGRAPSRRGRTAEASSDERGRATPAKRATADPTDETRAYLRGRAALTNDAHWQLGVDENGLGPQLGPLVVTAFGIRAPLRPTALGALVGDSKALVRFGDDALGEAWARAVVEHAKGEVAVDHGAVIAALLGYAGPPSTAPCPRHDASAPRAARILSMCWPPRDRAFEADRALVDACLAVLADVGPRGSVRAAAEVFCAAQLNAAFARGENKLRVDLHAMERLVDGFTRHGEPVDAVLGKVGGFDKYGPHFSTFGGRLRVTEVEGRVASSYRFAGVGRLAFVRDADAADPLVGLASLVGKFLRDRFMLRIGDWLRDGDDGAAELASVSGYHDPKTRAFVAASALVRDRRGVPETCFVRAR